MEGERNREREIEGRMRRETEGERGKERESMREKERDKERKRETETERERRREKKRERKRDIIGCSLLKMTFTTMDISMEINSVRMEKMIADDITNLNE